MESNYSEDYYDYTNYSFDSTESNNSPCKMSEINEIVYNIIVYIYIIISLLGFVGNSLVIITYACYKKSKSMTDMFLLNVAIADILFVISLPLEVIHVKYSWIMGNFPCKLLKGMYSINLYSGMLLLACIGTDRYVAIVQAKRSFNLRSIAWFYSLIVCLVVWIFAVAVSMPTFIFTKSIPLKNSTVCENSFPTLHAVTLKTVIPSLQISVGFFLPLFVMIFCYSRIICTLSRTRNLQRHKAVRVVMAVMVTFILCHLPYNIALLFDITKKFNTNSICEEQRTLVKTIIIAKCLASFHACLNPILYAFIGVKFRSHFCKIMKDICCLHKRFMPDRQTSPVTTDGFISRKSSGMVDINSASSFTM
ncbi:C-C chemokine receptor type 6-like [Polypterus senegalus]|uniref:C-C chemokine receptor type 6-like n=1 Tax=Polypterus senegalus TaxID=55291 RepID=UPI001964A457|nr:C-C chemokine receptor type 6-like [Polypterus senegalus]XP_039603626.1 C-C chemokine receptor type 6-like [Polypterus senegalus]XP_039603627.1 C-C chemokine receptor type 6-like [Polypterus senegalus]